MLADDHPAILRSMGALLADEGVEITGLAPTGREALRLMAVRRPAVALVDQHLPDISGVDVVRAAAPDSETAILLYTGDSGGTLAREALDAGASGVVLKEAPLADVVRAITMAASGSTYLDPLLAGGFVLAEAGSPKLTEREREVLRCLADGLTNQECGARLYLSPETIRAHLRKAMTKLGSSSRTHAVATALRGGLIA